MRFLRNRRSAKSFSIPAGTLMGKMRQMLVQIPAFPGFFPIPQHFENQFLFIFTFRWKRNFVNQSLCNVSLQARQLFPNHFPFLPLTGKYIPGSGGVDFLKSFLKVFKIQPAAIFDPIHISKQETVRVFHPESDCGPRGIRGSDIEFF